MRIGCLQFAPQVGDVDHNLNRADAVLNRVDPVDIENLDLLVLPEMAFSGYNFKSREQIIPFLEPPGSGISSLWARTTALKYDCIVAVGYPERARKEPSGEDHYNSLIVVNGDGETVANYRKSFLYYTDETWAKEGGGFYQGEIQDLGTVAMGICMDINPYKFQTPWSAFEFGFHVLTVKANLVIVSMAWLTLQDARTYTQLPQEPDMETLTYWVQRLEPIIRAEGEDEIIVVFANRCGVEGDAVYAGTSAVLGVQNGEVSVYGLLGRGAKELLVVNTEMPPFAKLVSRPDRPRDADDELSVSDGASESAFAAAQGGIGPSGQKSPGRNIPSSRRDNDTITRSRDHAYDEHTDAGYFNAPDYSDAHNVAGPREPVSPHRPEMVILLPASRRTQGELAPQSGLYQTKMTLENRPRKSVRAGDDEGLRDLASPSFPEPTPLSVRPKLAISTGPETLPPMPKREPPRGVQPGNFFSSRDLCTPPETPFDDEPQPFIQQHWIPNSTFMYTPEEPEWPDTVKGTEGVGQLPGSRRPSLGNIYAPPRAVPTRPASRTQEVRLSDLDDRRHNRNNDQGVLSRHASKSRNSSRARGPVPDRRPTPAPERNAPRLRTKQPELSTARPPVPPPQPPTTKLPAPTTQSSLGLRDSSSAFPWNSITIAASPSVFKTEFQRSETFPRSGPSAREEEEGSNNHHQHHHHHHPARRSSTTTSSSSNRDKLKRSKSASTFHRDPTNYLPSPALPVHKAYQDMIYSAVEPAASIDSMWAAAAQRQTSQDVVYSAVEPQAVGIDAVWAAAAAGSKRRQGSSVSSRLERGVARVPLGRLVRPDILSPMSV
ncbi:Carbon-nitrogen hydrolase [Coniochaeta hoffmannii]|uniref:Carbon-nitrogen hydrolase n=1 Tax=Coniochaeta hoffmannii TaxID=91930 RepID=A0AA38SAF4_9PEZI|nr:Carbon-nitrogen hydrolase [Coniochaeta hoffmannii]